MTLKRTISLIIVLCFVLSIFTAGAGEGAKPPSDATGFYHWIEIIQGDIPETQEVEAHNLLTVQDAMMYAIPWNVTRIHVNIPDGANLTRFLDVHSLYSNASFGLSDYPGWYYWEFPDEITREVSSQIVYNESLIFQEGTFNATKINITDNQIKLQDGLNLGEYVSNDIVVDGISVSSAKIIINSTYSENVSLSISNNNGTSWHPCLNDTYLDFDTNGASLKYKLNISGNSTIRPVVDYVEMSYNYTPMATTMALMTEYTITSNPEPPEFSFRKELLYDIEDTVIYLYVEEGHVIESVNVTWIDSHDPNITPAMKDKYPGKLLHVGTVEPGSVFSFTMNPVEETGNDSSLLIFAIIGLILIMVITVIYYRGREGRTAEKTDDADDLDDKDDSDEYAESETHENEDTTALLGQKENILKAIKRLDRDFEEGALSQKTYDELRTKYKEEAINIMKKLDKN